MVTHALPRPPSRPLRTHKPVLRKKKALELSKTSALALHPTPPIRRRCSRHRRRLRLPMCWQIRQPYRRAARALLHLVLSWPETILPPPQPPPPAFSTTLEQPAALPALLQAPAAATARWPRRAPPRSRSGAARCAARTRCPERPNISSISLEHGTGRQVLQRRRQQRRQKRRRRWRRRRQWRQCRRPLPWTRATAARSAAFER